MLGGTRLVISTVLVFFSVVGTANIAEGDGPTRGMVVVAMGGGSIEDAVFQNSVHGEGTFSFHAGYDKNGHFKGSFFFKRIFNGGVRSFRSTEITDVQILSDSSGTWMMMTGKGTLMADWLHKHLPDHLFSLCAWDLDTTGDGVDMIWFEVARPGGSVRSAMSLQDPCEIAGGNILMP